jgi:hypothetical protein
MLQHEHHDFHLNQYPFSLPIVCCRALKKSNTELKICTFATITQDKESEATENL